MVNPITNFMVRIPFCILAAGLIGAGLYSMMSCTTCQTLNQSFDAQQKAVFEHILNERRKLALQGLLLGLLISAFYLYYMGMSLNPLSNGCIYAGLTLAVQYFYYLLMPKSTYMVEHLNANQLGLYADANRTMQWRGIMGTLLGFIGLALIPFLLGA